MSQTQQSQIEACKGNGAGFLYALIEITDKATFENVSYAIGDEDFIKNNKVAYIGESSNPIERFTKHRSQKSRKIGMVIFDETDSDYPVPEIQMKENLAMYNHALAHGELPKWNKGALTFAGA
tara:strand:- start:45 stop:413 length:369 start_codon:yes stop_codon:yes gene_type:complete